MSLDTSHLLNILLRSKKFPHCEFLLSRVKARTHSPSYLVNRAGSANQTRSHMTSIYYMH